MNHLLFSLKIVFPLFALLSLGYVLRARKVIDAGFAKQANRFLFYVVMPLKFIKDLWGIDRGISLGWTLNGIVFVGTLLLCALAYLLSLRHRELTFSERGTYVQGAFRGNYVYVGYVLLERILGRFDPRAPLVLIVTMIVYNVLSVLLLQTPDRAKKPLAMVLGMILKILKNPLLIGVLMGLALNFIQLPHVEVIDATLEYISRLTTPLALLAIGASFRFSEVKSRSALALEAAFFKIVLGPVLVLWVAARMGLPPQDLILLYVVFGVPTAVSSYPLVSEMNGDEALAAGAILYSTAFSALSMAGFIAAFKALGWLASGV